MGSDNPTSADNQQERLDAPSIRTSENPQRPYAECAATTCGVVKRWSDLHGDMQSQAEMTWPPHRQASVGR